MFRLLTFLIVAAALAFVAVWFANNPGEVVVEFQGRTLRTSVGMLLLAFLAVGAVLIVLFELLRWLGGLPGRIGRRRRQEREVRGYQVLTRGLIEAAAGNLASARSLQREAERLLPERRATLLLAAQNAQLEGDEEAAHLRFQRMLDSPETELLGLRGLLAQAMRGGDRDEALRLARRAYRRSPTTHWVLTALFDLLTHANRWDEALGLVSEMEAQKLLSPDEARRHRGIVQHMVATRQRDDDQQREGLDQARRAVRLLPEFTPAAVLAADLAARQGQTRRARRLLEDAWQAAPHPDVARAYAGLVEGESPEQRLDRVERRLRPLRPDHPEFHAVVGELAIAAGRHDQARTALERGLALESTQRIYRLLAELERGAGRPELAEDWLSRAGDARPDNAWVCEDTGEVLPEWRPFGDSGRFDVVHWTTPPKVAPLLGRQHGPFLVGGTGTEPGTSEPAPAPAPQAAAATPSAVPSSSNGDGAAAATPVARDATTTALPDEDGLAGRRDGDADGQTSPDEEGERINGVRRGSSGGVPLPAAPPTAETGRPAS